MMEHFGNRIGDGHKAVLVSDLQDPLGGYPSARVSDLQLYSNLHHHLFLCLSLRNLYFGSRN